MSNSSDQRDDIYQTLMANSYLSAGNVNYLEDLYEAYLKDPESVSVEWRHYFKSLPPVKDDILNDVSHADIQQEFLELAKRSQKPSVVSGDALHERKQAGVNSLVRAYREFGHLIAQTDPLGSQRDSSLLLDITSHGLSTADYDTIFQVENLGQNGQATLRDIVRQLQETYCGSIGSEFTYIRNQEEVKWLQNYLETTRARASLTPEVKREVLKLLIAADGLEKFLGHKYVAQTRFSLEGGDSFIPFVYTMNQRAAMQGVKEIATGMAHRGRLNILVNIYGQSTEELYQEFEGRKDYGMTSGDVKYHLGISSDINTPAGPLHITLAFNPSHLEIVSPVVVGSVRARQDRRHDVEQDEAFALLVHGDASFAGQGVVMETLNMSQTRAYGIGGSIHIVINNQVGFTTSDPADARSSLYCTDVCRTDDIPVFHVNGDDVEAVVYAAQLAVDYRMKFKKDVLVDLVCYRRLGHNEGDEPAATQPLMYQFIRQHPTPREIYAEKLVKTGVCTQQEVEQWMGQYREALDAGRKVVETLPNGLTNQYASNWTPYLKEEGDAAVDTSVNKTKLIELAKRIEVLPEGFELQRQVGNLMASRAKMTEGELPLDWGYAEILAYASLLAEGHSIRISGQDSERGTFAHRHAVLYDQKTGRRYVPLNHLSQDQARFEIYNSLLSEAGAMAFEYGYASTAPNDLIIWEAQYGDFANGAQVVIDQFISSGWQKWQTLCGLTLFLPHGYEGKGPEHSSARLERYLQLCAQKNMQVVVPSTPAQIFHLLRRQILRPYRRPLIVMTPKSMLRHKLAVSTVDDLAKGKFYSVMPEMDEIKPDRVSRVVLCSGKLYYELLALRRERKLDQIAVLRIEQLYPFPYEELAAELKRYTKAKEVVWCQEEPRNQGAWFINRERMERCLQKGQQLYYAGRPSSASPAAGYMALHTKQQAELLNQALADKLVATDCD